MKGDWYIYFSLCEHSHDSCSVFTILFDIFMWHGPISIFIGYKELRVLSFVSDGESITPKSKGVPLNGIDD